MPIFDAAPDSSVLNAEELLAYPEPPAQSAEAVSTPVEPENSGEEVQP
jgi:hypothetical protein